MKAFAVRHGSWKQAVGYRFETADRTIVISGDTTPTQSVIDNCQSCDVLIHESYSMKAYNAVSAQAQANRKRLHTSTMQLAELAGKAMQEASLTADSNNEQSIVGLTHCTPEELKTIGQLKRINN